MRAVWGRPWLVSLGPGGGLGAGAGLGHLPGQGGATAAVCSLPTAHQYRLQGWMTSQGSSHPLLRGDTELSEAKLLRGRGAGHGGGEAG